METTDHPTEPTLEEDLEARARLRESPPTRVAWQGLVHMTLACGEERVVWDGTFKEAMLGALDTLSRAAAHSPAADTARSCIRGLLAEHLSDDRLRGNPWGLRIGDVAFQIESRNDPTREKQRVITEEAKG